MSLSLSLGDNSCFVSFDCKFFFQLYLVYLFESEMLRNCSLIIYYSHFVVYSVGFEICDFVFLFLSLDPGLFEIAVAVFRFGGLISLVLSSFMDTSHTKSKLLLAERYVKALDTFVVLLSSLL